MTTPAGLFCIDPPSAPRPAVVASPPGSPAPRRLGGSDLTFALLLAPGAVLAALLAWAVGLVAPFPTSTGPTAVADWIVPTAQLLAVAGLAVLLQACLMISAPRSVSAAHSRRKSTCRAI